MGADVMARDAFASELADEIVEVDVVDRSTERTVCPHYSHYSRKPRSSGSGRRPRVSNVREFASVAGFLRTLVLWVTYFSPSMTVLLAMVAQWNTENASYAS